MTKQAEKKYDYDSYGRYTVLKLEFIQSIPQKPTFIASKFLPNYL